MRFLSCIVIAGLLLAAPVATAAPDPAGNVPAAKKPAKEKASPRKFFKAVDANGDGQLTLAEIHAKRPGFPAEQFKKLDRNGDGTLIREEFAPRPAKRPAKASGANDRADILAYAKGLIAQCDIDGSGGITLAELQQAKPGFPEEAFIALDRNRDRVLDTADIGAPQSTPQRKKRADGPQKAPALERLRKGDTNKDGKLSFEEAQAAFPNLTRERFDARDRNKDSFLSPADRQAS